MDLTLADISKIPQTQVGDIAVVIGRSDRAEITAEEIGLLCFSAAIPYSSHKINNRYCFYYNYFFTRVNGFLIKLSVCCIVTVTV